MPSWRVPRYSQFLDVKSNVWRRRSCGIVAMKMVLDYWRGTARTPSLATLIREGAASHAYLRNAGWRHAGLSALARRHGLAGRRLDWRKLTAVQAFEKLRREAKRAPTITSIHRNLDPKRGGHLVVVTGIEKGTVFYHDPDSKSRRGVARRARTAKFLKGWRRRAIAVQPRKLPKRRKG